MVGHLNMVPHLRNLLYQGELLVLPQFIPVCTSCTLKTGTPIEDRDPILKLLRGVSHPQIQLGVSIHTTLILPFLHLITRKVKLSHFFWDCPMGHGSQPTTSARKWAGLPMISRSFLFHWGNDQHTNAYPGRKSPLSKLRNISRGSGILKATQYQPHLTWIPCILRPLIHSNTLSYIKDSLYFIHWNSAAQGNISDVQELAHKSVNKIVRGCISQKFN